MIIIDDIEQQKIDYGEDDESAIVVHFAMI